MADFDYFKGLLVSWKQLWANMRLFVPPILSIIISYALVGILFLFGFQELVKGEIQNIGLMVIGVIIYLILMIFIGSYIQGMNLGLVRDAVEKKKSKNMFTYGAKYFWRIILLLLFQILILVIPGLIVFGIIAGVLTLSLWAGIVVAIILGLAFLAYTIYILLSLLFFPVILVKTNKKFGEVLKTSFKYLRKHPSHTILTVLILIAAWVVIFVVLMAIFTPLGMVTQNILSLYVLVQVVQMLVSIALGLILQLYVFNAYYAKPFSKNP